MPDTMMEPIADAQPSWQPGSRSPTLGAFFAAVAKAQGEIEGAKKDSTNPHFKSQYADLASARDAVQGPLSKNELALVQWPRTADGGVEIETWLGHSSGEYMFGILWMPCKQMDAHGVGSAITYGRRYALMAVTGVAPIDDDGNAATGGSGVPGSAGGGGQFRPERRAPSSWGNGGKQGAVAEAQRDGLTANAPAAKPLPAAAGTRGTPKPLTPEQKAAKIKEATDKRVDILTSTTGWTRPTLDQFWTDNEEWIDYMSDKANGVLAEYERFTKAFAAAEKTIREVA